MNGGWTATLAEAWDAHLHGSLAEPAADVLAYPGASAGAVFPTP